MSFSTSLVRRTRSVLASATLLSCLAGAVTVSADPGPLLDYVQAPDASFNWKYTEQKKVGGFTADRLELVSQTWKEQFWSHHMILVRPKEMRHPEIALMFITGDGDGERYLEMLQQVADRAGATAAVITKIPNQPLYGGKKEDSLIAYTFDQYSKDKDKTWPLLFPMVKSAVRGMDTIQAFVQREYHQKVEGFALSGASKRGWTTWLTGATDKRVKAIAPMVIDTLNMKVQMKWAEKMYGKQSEQIRDYTDLNLVERMEEPGLQELWKWVDPYSYRASYTMPKLILLGTNDPYWVVDSLRNYWGDLPDQKLVFQTPNAGHDLGGGKEAIQTLAAWFGMIADRTELPKISWSFTPEGESKVKLSIKSSKPVQGFKLWTAESPDRDFRNDKWSSRDVEATNGGLETAVVVEKPEHGFRSYMGEVVLVDGHGKNYRLSTEARVIPDMVNKAN